MVAFLNFKLRICGHGDRLEVDWRQAVRSNSSNAEINLKSVVDIKENLNTTNKKRLNIKHSRQPSDG